MTGLLDPCIADRLAKLLGMLGSAHAYGERVSGAETVPEKIAFALAYIGALSIWERCLICEVNGRRSFSPKQLVVLDQIVAKAGAYAEGAA